MWGRGALLLGWLCAAIGTPTAAIAAAPQVERLPAGDTLVVVSDDRAPLVEIRLALPVGQASPWWRHHGGAAAWHIPLTDPVLHEQIDAVMALELSHDDWSSSLVARARQAELPEALALLEILLRAEGGVDRAALRRWRHGVVEPPWTLAAIDPRRALQAFVGRLLLAPGDPRREISPPSHLQAHRVRQARAILTRLPGRVLGFAGAISPAAARQAAIRILPPPLRQVPHTVTPDLPPLPPQTVPAGRPIQARIPGQGRSWVLVSRLGLAQDDPSRPHLLLAVHALAGAGRSRLYTRLRHEDELIYALDAVLGEGPVPGVFLIAAASSPRHLDAVADATQAELDRFAREGLTAEELAASQAALRLETALRHSDPSRTLASAVASVRHGLPADQDDRVQARADALALDEVNAFVAQFFAPDRLILVRAVAGPDWWLE